MGLYRHRARGLAWRASGSALARRMTILLPMAILRAGGAAAGGDVTCGEPPLFRGPQPRHTPRTGRRGRARSRPATESPATHVADSNPDRAFRTQPCSLQRTEQRDKARVKRQAFLSALSAATRERTAFMPGLRLRVVSSAHCMDWNRTCVYWSSRTNVNSAMRSPAVCGARASRSTSRADGATRAREGEAQRIRGRRPRPQPSRRARRRRVRATAHGARIPHASSC